MKKTILKVFLILAALVLVFLVWELFFADTGILHSVYNACAQGINGQWEKIAGDGQEILPMWDGENYGGNESNDNHHNDGGFDIDITNN